MFLGGSCDYRPFGDVILDGVDLDLELGTHDYYADFVIALRQLMNGATADQKPKNGRYWITGSPQCPYQDVEWTTIENSPTAASYIDLISVQFYPSQGGCEITASGFSSSFSTWTNWATQYGSANTKVYVGVPASPIAATLGYLDSDQLTTQLQPLFANPRFGGVMVWNVEYAYSNTNDTSFASNIYNLLQSTTTGTTVTEGLGNSTSNPLDNITSNNTSSKFGTPAIIGVTIGGFVFIAIVATVTLFVMRRKRVGCTTVMKHILTLLKFIDQSYTYALASMCLSSPNTFDSLIHLAKY
jgi:chitinase